MSLSERPIQTEEVQGQPELVEVSSYRNWKEGFDHGLVVLAMGEAFWLEPTGDRFRLLVEPHAVEQVTEQLMRYEHESINWPPLEASDATSRQKIDLFTPLIWAVLVLASFWVQGEWRGWTNSGLLDVQAVFDRGEGWRLFTALFLHDDLGHLISNVVSGVFVFAAMLTTMGRLRGWLLLMLAAVAGNLAAAAVHYPEVYRSLGASTAVFAAVGLLTGRSLRMVLRAGHPHRWRTLFVPFAAGLTVLGLFGAGGQQVDVMAHLTGFAAGLILGFAYGAR